MPKRNPFETNLDSRMYPLAMRKMVICLSGFKDKSTKEELEQLVKWMNGSLSPALIRHVVTHVVTATAYTPKCIAANEEGIPVMTEDWVRQVFKDNRKLPVSASDPRYVKFRCPTFYKVNICMSQITHVKRNILKAGIEKNGGQVFSELVKKETDVLVVQNATGDKYKFAQEWNVKCVTPQWVGDSIKKGYLLPPEDYPPVDSYRSGLPVFPNPNNLPVTSEPKPSTPKAAPQEPKPSTSKAAPQEPKPSASKAAQQEPSKDVLKTPPSASMQVNKEVNNISSKILKKTVTSATEKVIGLGGHKFDDFEKNFSPCPTQEEIDKKMAEFKAIFPYSDESYERLLKDMEARGVDLDAVSPFTSFEERRLCNPDPDSPLFLGLPRLESRAEKEQFEIAFNRTPNIPKIKVRTPKKTPLNEIRRRLNEVLAQMPAGDPESPDASLRRVSTPKPSLRKAEVLSLLSQGNPNGSIIQNDVEDLDTDLLAGLRKLGSKRPSDGSLEDEDSKSSKRARKSSNEDSGREEMVSEASTSPNENHVPNQLKDNDQPTTSKKPNRMQILTNLIAESLANPNYDATGGSPIKRRPGDNKELLQPMESQEIERPHIGWRDDDRSVSFKGPTVKTVLPKISIHSAQDPGLSTVHLDNPEQKEIGRKRSTRLRKAPSILNMQESCGRVTRQTRSRKKN